ncbi:MAG: RNA-binding S4 domain-containing protein [Opitutaceae bacterium]
MKNDSSAGSAPIRTVTVENLPIELCKILKMEGLVRSGGEAKHVIADGRVILNGEVETRKRRQIVAGDRIIFAGVSLLVAPGADRTGEAAHPQRRGVSDA